MRYKDLLEGMKIRKGLQFTLPPTYVMPDLPNNDSYKQYRHLVALAAARAAKDEDATVDDEMAWGQDQSVVCYTTADQETLRLANEIMGVSSVALSSTPSQESPHRNTVSPVRKFVDLSESESIRGLIDSINHPRV